MTSQNGTEGRVYGGDCDLIHIADGNRATIGAQMATMLDMTMRMDAAQDGRRTLEQAMAQDLCPGCYMIAGLNMLVTLAEQNGQSLSELGRTMAAAFTMLADQAETGQGFHPEEIAVILDR